MRSVILLILLALIPSSCGDTMCPRSVPVAAIQMSSEMGETRRNRRKLERLIRDAASQGAKIIVTPECALQGYMEPGYDNVWASEPSEGCLPVAEVAETVPGESTDHFADLARELDLYLALGLIEKADGRFYNTQVLLDPEGRVAGHHRKRRLWAPGDGLWASEGNLPLPVIDTPHGRLGMMICYDFRELMPRYAEKGIDILLYSVGWFGLNTDSWFRERFPDSHVRTHGFAVIAANWAASPQDADWSGHGYSSIYDPAGRIIAEGDDSVEDRVVLGVIEIE